MTRERHRPRQAAASAYLRAYLRDTASARLPAVAVCAREAGVSYVTMWKAVDALRRSGELVQASPTRPLAEPRESRWQTVRARLIRDIVSGRHATGASIGAKQVTADYGACYRTARQALEALAAHGWLVREKKHYRVRSPATGGFGGTVVLISNVDRSRSVTALSPRLQELVRACEIHCSRMRLGLDPVLMRPGSTAGDLESLRIPAGPDIAGYLIWLGNISAEALEALLTRLSATGKPVSVLDEVGEVAQARPVVGAANVALFSMANSTNAGVAMGRHLLGLGHRGIGFLMVRQQQPWAENRCAGVRAAADAAGPGNVLRPFVADWGSPAEQVAPLLRSVLEDRAITAIVAQTDPMGIACLSWLADRGIRAGRDLSVAAFDDTPDAFIHNLTSYNFNCEATVHAMLAHLFGRRLHTHARGPVEATEIEGFVTPRKSTGRPGKGGDGW